MSGKHNLGWLFLTVAPPVVLAPDPAAVPAAVRQDAAKGATAQMSAAAPPRMIDLFIKRGSCPEGWEPSSNTYGRMLLGTTSGGNVGVKAGRQMQPGYPPQHEHTVSFTVRLASKGLAAANGGSNNIGGSNGTRTGSTTAKSYFTGLPFYGYMACRVPLGGVQ